MNQRHIIEYRCLSLYGTSVSFRTFLENWVPLEFWVVFYEEYRYLFSILESTLALLGGSLCKSQHQTIMLRNVWCRGPFKENGDKRILFWAIINYKEKELLMLESNNTQLWGLLKPTRKTQPSYYKVVTRWQIEVALARSVTLRPVNKIRLCPFSRAWRPLTFWYYSPCITKMVAKFQAPKAKLQEN